MERDKESFANHCHPKEVGHILNTVPSKERNQRLHTAGEIDFTKQSNQVTKQKKENKQQKQISVRRG